MFCGWDWGSTRHGVCLIDDEGQVVKTWMIEHTEPSPTVTVATTSRHQEALQVIQTPIGCNP
jgi:hypothetical protein